jgi:SAM-dependent methyltransferase
MRIIEKLFGHPQTRGLAVDDPRTTLLRRDIIQRKAFLRALYCEWYEQIVNALPKTDDVLELGSGPGFFRQFLPNVITSEVFETPDVSLIADACDLPFSDQSLDAIVMTDVFHHIPDVALFLVEATRCVRPGGKIVMVEPWLTSWSAWVYTTLHTEPFLPDSSWKIPGTGPLSAANGALPWIVFERDKDAFEVQYPLWHIKNIAPLMPLSYILSGGVSMRSLMPGWMYRQIRNLERTLFERRWAMFALIELERLP